jgi:hypothetical protein
LSGTWNADLASFSGKTIHAMLRMIRFGIVLQSSRLGDDRRSVILDGGSRAAVMSYPFASAVTIINAVSMPQWCARPALDPNLTSDFYNGVLFLDLYSGESRLFLARECFAVLSVKYMQIGRSEPD